MRYYQLLTQPLFFNAEVCMSHGYIIIIIIIIIIAVDRFQHVTLIIKNFPIF